MAPVTQVLLLLSYAILGAAAVIIPPRLFGFDSQVSVFLGMLVFFGAWQIQNWLITNRSVADSKQRLEHLEDVSHILRKDLERARRELESRGRMSEEKSELLVSELKVLQTLIGQVARKELELKGSAIPAGGMPDPSEEEALSLSIGHKKRKTSPKTETAAEDLTDAEMGAFDLTPEEMALVDQDIVQDENADEILDGEAPNDVVVGQPRRGRAGRPVTPKRKAPIRIIKREDQLLSVVRSSLSENRVDLYLQPIVGLPSRKTVHYECFSRVRDEEGRIILPRQYLKVAESKGLIGTIDNLLLFRLIQLVRRIGKRRPELRFFCNMSRYSMTDSEFFPQFIDFMLANAEFAKRLVFEISQADFNVLEDDVLDRLQTLGNKGFGFSMDMVSTFEQDFPALQPLNFQFIKSDLRDLVATHPEEGSIEAFKSTLRRKGMQLVASRIESEANVLQALEFQIEYAQGYLFGEPAAASDLDRDI